MTLRPSTSLFALLQGFFLLVSARAVAQAEPDADEDVEVPAAPTPPSSTVPGPAPATAPADVEARQAESSPAESAPQGATAPIAPAPTDTPSADDAEAAEPPPTQGTGKTTTNLEQRAWGRPVPVGLTIGGFLQAQYQHNALSEDQLQPGGEPLNDDRFLLRRARLRVDRGWEYVAGTLELEASTFRGVTFGIRRAEGSLLYRGSNPDDRPPLAMLTLGITDIPFGYELLEGARARVFTERTLASQALFPTEMDAGAKLSGAIGFVRYGIAVTNGEPVRSGELPRDPNAAKDISGRGGVDVLVTPNLGLAGGASFAVGKGFHAGTPAGKRGLGWNDLDEDGSPSLNEIVGILPVAETASQNFDRWVFGLDLGFRLKTPLGLSHVYGELYVGSNYDRGFLASDPVVTGADVRQAGGYVALVQEFAEYGLLGFRYSVYDPNSDLIESRANNFYPKTQTIKTYSILAGAEIKGQGRLTFQYDIVRDYLARDRVGVPTDADNNQWTLRLQVEL